MSKYQWLCRISIASLSLVSFAACGGDDDDDDGDGDGGAQVDAGSQGGDCAAGASLGTFGPEDGAEAFHFTQDQDPSLRLLSVVADVTREGQLPDLLIIQLWDAFG